MEKPGNLMPRHQHAYLCLKSLKSCTCATCARAYCAVCEASEWSLTTDCPGTKVAYTRQQEVYATSLDYTDRRGWHQATKPRAPRFMSAIQAPIDPPAKITPSTALALAGTAPLQLELTLKAVAWVCADRLADNLSATLTSLEEELGSMTVSKTREHAKIAFQRASQHADKCDDEFRQAARQLVAALEQPPTHQEV